ncbi:hypothetical protein L6452_35394 [Arctium lappa]|uniref:Uncharacterized protein n=1 Tax=Arctium lappa TaxID=4217 RepID=A0ACB8Y6C5_ARCLA|nr:hypothetical protein L6452_35394 [Arctium lappa]
MIRGAEVYDPWIRQSGRVVSVDGLTANLTDRFGAIIGKGRSQTSRRTANQGPFGHDVGRQQRIGVVIFKALFFRKKETK